MEAVTFGAILSAFLLTPPSIPTFHEPAAYWEWVGAEEYKNERLRLYQRKLAKRGIEDTRLLVAQLIQENGALTEDRIGDNGCSLGLIQYNACVHFRISATRLMQKHPEWGTLDHQLDWMADTVRDRMKKYRDLRRTIVHHNCPVCAAAGTDTNAGYYAQIVRKANLLELVPAAN